MSTNIPKFISLEWSGGGYIIDFGAIKENFLGAIASYFKIEFVLSCKLVYCVFSIAYKSESSFI